MATNTNEILVWQDGTPVVDITPNEEFNVWQDGAPVVAMDESFSSGTPTPTNVRRRVAIF